jgi:hypothetical protein
LRRKKMSEFRTPKMDERLLRLSELLGDTKLGDDYVDWDDRDWTIFALDFLIANWDDAKELVEVDDDVHTVNDDYWPDMAQLDQDVLRIINKKNDDGTDPILRWD